MAAQLSCWNSDNFKVPLVLLCCYGFFKEVRPSEPFLTEYLSDQRWGNISLNDLSSKVYPVYTYSSFVLLLPVFLLTDFVRYKPVIVLGGIAYITTWVLLLWAKGIAAMQVMEFSYGLVTSTEVAYYTYIYAKVCKIFNSPLYKSQEK